ncbi:LPS export ABC transporter permease LptG [Elongatibacter sediminis]|uniref:LPS export ABC transporter permease LptG n=1 Tax=Elongatibacter sediminis TaxID=3119006 RepID=A0AAW9R7K2_9GAMM
MITLFDRYLMRRFLVGTLPVLLLLLILFSFLALADELEDVGQGSFTLFDAFRVVLYTAPRRIVDLMPVTLLLGGLIGLGAMANHQELIAARAAGMSRHRIGRPVLILAMGVGLVVVTAQAFLIPLAEREAGDIRARKLADASLSAERRTGFWTRSENRIVRVNEVRYGQLLTDLEVYVLDDEGRLLELVRAERATVRDPDDWRLDSVTVTRMGDWAAEEEHRESLDWPGLLSREQAGILVRPLETLAPHELVRLIGIQRANGLNDQAHRVTLWQQLSIPVALIGMALLSLPLLLGSVRMVSAGSRVVIGGFVGIAFYLVQQLTGHLAGLFSLNPPLLIMTPAVVLLIVAVYTQFLERPRPRRRRRRAR